MNDPFVERISRTRTNKLKKSSGGIVKIRIKKTYEGQKARLEAEIYPDLALDENRAGHGTEGNRNRKLASVSTPVEQGHDFATSTGTLDREEMSELCDITTLKM